MSRRFYLASRYSRRDELKDYRFDLQALGYKVTSRWLDTDYPSQEVGAANAPEDDRTQIAVMDLEDIRNCDTIINFTCEGKGRGGRHVELGYALALCKQVILVGEPEHVFHYHPEVRWYPDWGGLHWAITEDFLGLL